ncbi:MAG: hypothetical protein WD960_09195 [Gemmatimonadota bacterium]
MSLTGTHGWKYVAWVGALTLLALTTVACQAEASPGADASVPGADTAEDADDREWSFRYSGDATGEVSGTVSAITTMTISMNEVSIAARAHGSDVMFTATYGYARDADPVGEMRLRTFALELEDGSRCSPDPRAEQAVVANVIDGSKDTYRAEFSGSLTCDDDRVIDITGRLRRG